MPRMLISLLKLCVLFQFLFYVSAARAEYYVVYSTVSYSSCNDCCYESRGTRMSYKGEGYQKQRVQSRGCYNVTTARPVSTYMVTPPVPACPCDEWTRSCRCGNWQPGYWQGVSYISPAEQVFLHGSPDVTDENDFDYDRRTADDIRADLNVDI